jgi:hypothetical protein
VDEKDNKRKADDESPFAAKKAKVDEAESESESKEDVKRKVDDAWALGVKRLSVILIANHHTCGKGSRSCEGSLR